jgi:signal peptidase I
MTIVKRHTRAFVEVAGHVLAAGCSIRFRAEGTSMRPAINDGDLITVKAQGRESLQGGQVIVYLREHRPLAHRVVAILTTAAGNVLVVSRGDARPADDAPVDAGCVLGKVTSIQRDRAGRLTVLRPRRTALSRLGRVVRESARVALTALAVG